MSIQVPTANETVITLLTKILLNQGSSAVPTANESEITLLRKILANQVSAILGNLGLTPQFDRVGIGTAPDATALLKLGALEGLLRATAGVVDPITYMEGEFTPTMTFSTPGDLSVVYTVQNGRYRRIDDLVFIFMRLDCTPTYASASGSLFIEGLPFTVVDNADGGQVMEIDIVTSSVTWPAGGTDLTVSPANNATRMVILSTGSGAVRGVFGTAQYPSGAARNIRISGCYLAAPL